MRAPAPPATASHKLTEKEFRELERLVEENKMTSPEDEERMLAR
jgi:hypothetical protein